VDAAAVAAFKGECHLLRAGADGFGDAADAAVDKVGPAISTDNPPLYFSEMSSRVMTRQKGV